jgi:hypothetical protein
MEYCKSTFRSAIALRCAAAFTVLVAMIVGCGRSDRATVYPAEGQVLWYGKPLAGAHVVFYPKQTSDGKPIAPRAQTGSDGRFRLGTYDADDGAPEGDYAVTVHYYPIRPGEGGASGNALPPKFASAKTTDLHVQIAKGPNALPPLELTARR